jgi:hypothetical protein
VSLRGLFPAGQQGPEATRELCAQQNATASISYNFVEKSESVEIGALNQAPRIVENGS